MIAVNTPTIEHDSGCKKSREKNEKKVKKTLLKPFSLLLETTTSCSLFTLESHILWFKELDLPTNYRFLVHLFSTGTSNIFGKNIKVD